MAAPNAIVPSRGVSMPRLARRAQRATRIGVARKTTSELIEMNQVIGMAQPEVTCRSMPVSAHKAMVLPTCS